MEGQITAHESTISALKAEQQVLLSEHEEAKKDVQEYSKEVLETQHLYQNELMQHGKSMEELLNWKTVVSIGGRGEGIGESGLFYVPFYF